jgi:hypothetical protein
VTFLGISAKILPNGPGILGAAAGVGYHLSAVGFHLGGEQNPLFYGGALLLVLGYSAWATGLRGLFLSGGLILSG